MGKMTPNYSYINIIVSNSRFETFSCSCLRRAVTVIGKGKIKNGIVALSKDCNGLPNEQIKSLYHHRPVFTFLLKGLPVDRLIKKCPHDTPLIIRKLIERIKTTDFILSIERNSILNNLLEIEQTYQMLFTKSLKNGLNDMLNNEIPDLANLEEFIRRINHSRNDINQKCHEILNDLYGKQDKLYV
jgi:hypothetical protein